MNPRITKAATITALKAGGVLRTARVGSRTWTTLTTADGREFRVTRSTLTAVLDAIGESLSFTRPRSGLTERRYVPLGGAA